MDITGITVVCSVVAVLGVVVFTTAYYFIAKAWNQ